LLAQSRLSLRFGSSLEIGRKLLKGDGHIGNGTAD
jgi:hypothetical protein